MSVEIAASEPERRALEPVLRELLGRLGVTVALSASSEIEARRVLEPPPATEPALARVFIDATAPGSVLLYLVDSTWQRVLVRRLPLEHGLDEVAREELAHVVEASVLALQRGGSIGVARDVAGAELGVVPSAPIEPPPAAEPEARATPPSLVARSIPVQTAATPRGDAFRRTPLRLELGAGVQGAFWLADELAAGPLVRAELLQRWQDWSLGAGALLGYRLPAEHDAEPVGLALESVSAVALVSAGWHRASARYFAELGVGRELVRFAPRVTGPTALELAHVRAGWTTIAYGALGASYELRGHVSLRAAVTSELALPPRDFVLSRAGDSETIAKTLRLRPGFLVAVALAWDAG